MDEPELLRALYQNVTDLMLLCLDMFPRVDGRTLHTIFVGDCSVAMISPAQYEACNSVSDGRLCDYARGIGARFVVHQDSGATPHLPGYAALGAVHGIDFGQDTDWAAAAELFPNAEANCIIFPSWLHATATEEIGAELERIMRIGSRFPRFTFTLLELDTRLAEGKVFEFHEAFRAAAARVRP